MLEIRLTVAQPHRAARRDVVVLLDPTGRVADLEQALDTGTGQLWLADKQLDSTATLRDAGIRDGVLVSQGGPLREAQEPAAAIELRLVSGPEAGAIYPLPDGDTVVGGPGTAIALTGAGLAWEQLRLHHGPSGVVATNLDQTYPVCRNGVALLGPVALAPDDQLQVGEHVLGFALVEPTSPDLTGPDLTLTVERPERHRPVLDSRTLELPAEPTRSDPRRRPLLPLAVPLLLGLAFGVLLSPWFLVLLLAVPALGYLLTWRAGGAADRLLDEQIREHGQDMAQYAADKTHLLRTETAFLRDSAPDAAALLRTATGTGSRLWERGREGADALVLRLGTTEAVATSVEVIASEGVVAPRPSVLHEVPLTLPLREAGVVGIVGLLATRRGLARWLVGQAAVLHSPDDLSIWLLTPSTPDSTLEEADWGWLRWLPHSKGVPELCASLVGSTDESLAGRVGELRALIAHRAALARDPQTETARPADVLVVLDGVKALRDVAGVNEILREGPALGVHCVCLGSSAADLPPEAKTTIAVEPNGRISLRRTGRARVEGVRPDLVGPAWAERVARALAPLRLTDRSSGPLPFSVRLLDLLGIEPAAGAVLERWVQARPAPLGVGEHGPVEVELSSAGPHLLFAGAGSAGVLQAAVASLAASHRPDALALVLVGESFADLDQLPHTSSVVNDLDGGAAARAIASLGAELNRRERLLASVAATDIEAYLGSGYPLPRLVLAVDEVTGQLPELVSGLVELSNRGGPLGLHLLLATSQPSAAPAVAGLRLALRVDKAADSQQVLGSRVAASVLAAVPGRGYLRTGDGPLVAIQAASLEAAPAEQAVVKELTWPSLGLPLHEPVAGASDLARLVKAIREAAETLDLPVPASPWLEPLPDRVVLGDLPTAAGVVLGLEDLPAQQTQPPAGWDLERGGHLLVVGAPRSGRSTLLRTLAVSLTSTVTASDAHLYALDCGSGQLAGLAALPHCGAVVTVSEPERAERLLTRLAAEVERRRRQLAERGFADLSGQRAGTADPLPYLVLLIDSWEGFAAALERHTDILLELLREGGPAGLRVVLTGDRSLLSTELAAAVPDRLVLRLDDRSDYASAGLTPVSIPSQVPAGRGFRATAGATVPAVASVQVALLTADGSESGQAAALRDHAATLPPARGRKPFRVDVLPERVTVSEARELGASGPGAEFAVGGDELRLQTVNLLTCGPGFTIAGPPRSGRSTALAVLARSLLETGTQLCLITPVASPLSELSDLAGVLIAEQSPLAGDLRRLLDRTNGPVAVLVDDAEQVADDQLDELLTDELRKGRSGLHSIVVAGGLEELSAIHGGFAFDARKSRSGLLLSPDSASYGDLLGVRLPATAAFSGPPGRGLLLRSGQVQLVQVPLPD